MKKRKKNMAAAKLNAVAYLVANPDASAYAVAKETGVTHYTAQKLIRQRQTPVDTLKPVTKPGVDMLEEAVRVFKQRSEEYGSCLDTLSDIAHIWSGILRQPISCEEVALMMVGLKMARLKRQPLHRDSIVDIAGWAAVYAEGVR
jgi:hypothetical protein